MKQLTIRGVNEQLHQALRREADQQGMSINRYVLGLLKESLGLGHGDNLGEVEFDDLDNLAGTWTQEAYEQFAEQLQMQRPIDSEMWP